MKAHYKIAIIGFGSIAKRHLHNMAEVLNRKGFSYQIDLIRSNNNAIINDDYQRHVANSYYSYNDVPDDYDIIFITNPTNLHMETIKAYAKKARHMFIEKPLANNVDVCIEELNLCKDGVYYVACPLRYTGVIQHLKNNCDLSKTYSVRIICSSYLPDWRVGVDYTKSYSACKEMGGGVSLDLIHEWDYLCYLFGYPLNILNMRGKYSDLQIDSDDLSIYVAEYTNMLATIHLDYFGRKTIREIQIFTDNDTIIGDIISSEVRYLKENKVVSFIESRDSFQIKELEYFFKIIEGKEDNTNDIATAIKTLKMATGGINQ